jgi:hypothetical protein
MMRHSRFLGVAIRAGLVLALLIAPPLTQRTANAQAISTNGGSIQGTITDPSGAVIPGVKITISSPETGYTKALTADAAGFYSLGPLLPGRYTITVEEAGFDRLVRSARAMRS